MALSGLINIEELLNEERRVLTLSEALDHNFSLLEKNTRKSLTIEANNDDELNSILNTIAKDRGYDGMIDLIGITEYGSKIYPIKTYSLIQLCAYDNSYIGTEDYQVQQIIIGPSVVSILDTFKLTTNVEHAYMNMRYINFPNRLPNNNWTTYNIGTVNETYGGLISPEQFSNLEIEPIPLNVITDLN